VNQDKTDDALHGRQHILGTFEYFKIFPWLDPSVFTTTNDSTILHNKIKDCCTLFVFDESSADDEAKDDKKKKLMDLIEYENVNFWC
jgi:hypothetical protein